MRTRILMIAAGLCLATTTALQAGDASLSAEQREMQQLLSQMPEVPEAERLLMEHAIREHALASTDRMDSERREMLDMLQRMDLPVRERQLMQQAILSMDEMSLEVPMQVVCSLPKIEEEKTCGNA